MEAAVDRRACSVSSDAVVAGTPDAALLPRPVGRRVSPDVLPLTELTASVAPQAAAAPCAAAKRPDALRVSEDVRVASVCQAPRCAAGLSAARSAVEPAAARERFRPEVLPREQVPQPRRRLLLVVVPVRELVR
jgi:hypothetical protein